MTAAAATTGTSTRPVALFVLGMPRSGTAALTRVLSLCGAALPAGLVGALPANPRGFWEPRKANYLNEALLHRHGSTMLDPTLRPLDRSVDPEEEASCVAKIRAFLGTLPAARLLVIKDPRITVLSGMWFEAARLAGFDVVTVVAVRHPQEVAASVAASSGASPELSSALWLKYNLLAERHTRGLPRVFVEYANFLDNWRGEVKRISAALAIGLDIRDDGAIDDFLEPDLRRQRHCGLVAEPFGTDWISVAYDALQAAARDELWDESALDRVFEAYRASEHGFRIAFEDYQSRSNRVLFHPLIQKLIFEVLATVHLRRGTWA